jgi:hypothetical protein
MNRTNGSFMYPQLICDGDKSAWINAVSVGTAPTATTSEVNNCKRTSASLRVTTAGNSCRRRNRRRTTRFSAKCIVVADCCHFFLWNCVHFRRWPSIPLQPSRGGSPGARLSPWGATARSLDRDTTGTRRRRRRARRHVVVRAHGNV